MEPLIVLAEKKQLPAHQFMDRETLEWIVSKDPFKGETTEFESITPGISGKIHEFRLPEKWFLCSKGIDTIHGLRHLLRVAANGMYLLQYNDNKDAYENTIFLSALLHDISRKDDQTDKEHATRAAEWFLKHQALIEEEFFSLNNVEKEDIYYAILLHEKSLEQLTDTAEYSNHKKAIDLLKIADALDRYRQPKMKWWINDKKVPSPPPISAKQFAFKLVVKSETNYLKGLNNYNSVFSALEEL